MVDIFSIKSSRYVDIQYLTQQYLQNNQNFKSFESQSQSESIHHSPSILVQKAPHSQRVCNDFSVAGKRVIGHFPVCLTQGQMQSQQKTQPEIRKRVGFFMVFMQIGQCFDSTLEGIEGALTIYFSTLPTAATLFSLPLCQKYHEMILWAIITINSPGFLMSYQTGYFSSGSLGLWVSFTPLILYSKLQGRGDQAVFLQRQSNLQIALMSEIIVCKQGKIFVKRAANVERSMPSNCLPRHSLQQDSNLLQRQGITVQITAPKTIYFLFKFPLLSAPQKPQAYNPLSLLRHQSYFPKSKSKAISFEKYRNRINDGQELRIVETRQQRPEERQSCSVSISKCQKKCNVDCDAIMLYIALEFIVYTV